MLHALHFREVKVAKRGNHGPLLTARRKDGSLELRWAIRVHRGNGPVDRRAVQDCRRDLQHHSAHVALLLATGDLRSDARSEALSGVPVHVWAGEGLAEKFLESHCGVRVVSLELFELDRGFFEDAARGAEESRRRREERHREREHAERMEVSESPEPVEAEGPEDEGGPDDDGEDEGPDEGGAEAGAAVAEGTPGEAGSGERKRRRRRRRGRRGRGRAEGAPGSGGGEAGAGAASASGSPPAGQEGSGSTPDGAEAPEPASGGGHSSSPQDG